MSALLKTGYRVYGCYIYFGGIVLPYMAYGIRLEGQPFAYLSLRHVRRPADCGWDSELSLLYYRELLHYKSDPFEAAALGDEHWCKHRIDMALVRGDEVIRMEVLHQPSLKQDGEQNPVIKLKKCLRSQHLFRLFATTAT